MAVEKQDDVQLEFKASDDAWYDVSLALNDSKLLVHYLGFPPEDDEKFTIEDFKSVDGLRARFRYSSQQLQDENCGLLKKRMKICASFGRENEDNRFYNAVVKRVLRSKHHHKGGEEVCKCTFEVLWEDGPCVNTITSVTCENICLLTSGDIENNSTIKLFIKVLEENIEIYHKNTIKKKAANVKAKYKDEQREAVKTESNLASINGLEGSYIISGVERLENHSDLFKQSVGPRNTLDTVFSGINEVAASTPHVPPMSTQSTNDMSNAVDNDAIDCETKNREEVLKATIEAPLCPIGKTANEALHTEAILIEQEETHLDSLNKERKRKYVSMDLNSNIELEHEQLEIPSHCETSLMPQEEASVDLVSKKQEAGLGLSTKIELEQEKLDIPTTRVGFHGNSKNADEMDNGVFGISKIVGSLNNQGPFHSGWLEAEDCATPQIRKGGFNAIIKEIAINSACFTADVRKKGTGLSDDNEVSAITGIERPSSYDFGKLDEQVIVGENRNDEGKREGKKVLPSCWGKGKRQKHISNELFTGENVNTSKQLIQNDNDFDGVATLSSSFLTPDLKNSANHFTTEGLIFTAAMEKVDAVRGGINHAKVSKQEKCLPVEENNHDTIMKKCDNEIPDLNMQPDNHIHLEGVLYTSEEMKAGCTYRVNFEGQNNLSSIHRDLNSHYASVKSNYWSCDCSRAINMPSCDSEQDLERCHSHLTSKECESHTSECCCDLHSCHTNTSSEEESFDIEVSSCNCCGKYLKPNVLNNRISTRIHKGPEEARCGCSGAQLGYCGEDIGAEDRLFNCSEILVLDNLEKDVRPSDVKKVMACVTCAVHVYIFPSLKFEQFTKGFVWFRDHSSLMKALAIFQNDDFFITSSKGRPWVALLLHTDNEVCKGIIGGYDIEPEDCQHSCSKTLPRKILRVYKGTDEYERAKKMKNTFLEFKEHLAILHRRLELEECSED